MFTPSLSVLLTKEVKGGCGVGHGDAGNSHRVGRLFSSRLALLNRNAAIASATTCA